MRKPAKTGTARPVHERLLDTACDVFAERGYRGASVEELAARAKTTKPTLYAHFGDKQRLYAACLNSQAERLSEALFATYDRAARLPLDEQVHADMLAFYDYAAAHPGGFRLLFDDRADESPHPIRGELLRSITARVAERVTAVATAHDRRIDSATVGMLADILVGIAVHGARYALRAHPDDLGRAGALAASFATAGLRHLDPALLDSHS
ncbi:TetR/AcrR family transcriptional regulator [Sciscionella marina]|uniref:TetR/AcrR family transcriptional regulator n=1 Tax=Sciscionella marina TaxID=508770 RepID=UPI00146C87B2|nr:TetR/AcrR family transcriptional regulator [Sciscionella marina]